MLVNLTKSSILFQETVLDLTDLKQAIYIYDDWYWLRAINKIEKIELATGMSFLTDLL